jgi:hypothetical protein
MYLFPYVGSLVGRSACMYVCIHSFTTLMEVNVVLSSEGLSLWAWSVLDSDPASERFVLPW